MQHLKATVSILQCTVVKRVTHGPLAVERLWTLIEIYGHAYQPSLVLRIAQDLMSSRDLPLGIQYGTQYNLNFILGCLSSCKSHLLACPRGH